eukprot:2491986-Lingulodinium_polyedra.AAC.1
MTTTVAHQTGGHARGNLLRRRCAHLTNTHRGPDPKQATPATYPDPALHGSTARQTTPASPTGPKPHGPATRTATHANPPGCR